VRGRTDSELVAAARTGDRAAFAALLDRHDRAVRAAARRLLGPDEAEDVAQEAFLQAYLGLDRLRDPARFGAWLCAIAVNLARMRLRERRLHLPLGDYPHSDGGWDTEEVSESVAAALEVLPRHERDAVVLSYVEGLSSPEVAALTGERPGTVRVRLHRARGRLRARLGALTPQGGKEKTMIEVIVQDVVVRATTKNGGEPQLVGETRIVLLKEKNREADPPDLDRPARSGRACTRARR
jgi:RNA polymerase sigma-70 factor, ECF subfamily